MNNNQTASRARGTNMITPVTPIKYRPLVILLTLLPGCTAAHFGFDIPASPPLRVPASSSPPPAAALWAAEALGQIRSALYLPDQRLYGEETGPGRGRPRPAFVWPSSVMLSALASAASVD